MQISISQQRAIAHREGPAMVLAGPGSGKTLVIASRVSRLIREGTARPEQILVITFTRAAAAQMRQRFEDMQPGAAKPGAGGRVTFGTFHSIFFQILRLAYHYQPSQILREERKLDILQDIAARCGAGQDDLRAAALQLGAEISLIKNEQIPLEHFYSGVCGAETFRSVYRAYTGRIEREHLLDFDDMLVYTKELFSKRPDILALWQKRFPFILVDEFQDINALQYDTLRMLAKPADNLFVVGDDDQSVYRFRGAHPEIMLRFPKDYPSAVLYRLEENYRSAQAVVDAAGSVIAGNKKRFAKKITAVRGDMEGRVTIRSFQDEAAQSAYVTEMIRQSAARKRPWREMAVLTRTNTGGRYLAQRLLELDIPFVMRDVSPDLYDHWIAQDLFSYVRLAVGGDDRRDFLRIMNRPLRYISRDCVQEAHISFPVLIGRCSGRPWIQDRLRCLENDLETAGRMKPFAALNYLRAAVGYDTFLREYAKEKGTDPDELLDIAGELQDQAARFDSWEAWEEHILAYRKELEAQRQALSSGKTPRDGVVITTLHGAKGLEFDEVFLPDLCEGNMPYRKAVLEADLEEERRLLYVGMTRARKRLHLLSVRERFGKEQEISRFLQPLLM